ncbi:MAG TPA: cupin domain-containing protein [Rectinemataceae bacterium]|nr:cupin domain-containing protein [Rectinemataceae bacterium]
MFGLNSTHGYREIASGIRIKTIARGERTLMASFSMEAGSELPEHAHPYEQTGYLVRGRLRLHIGASSRELGSGCSWCIPSGVSHRAEILEDSTAIEVFSPAHTDYLAYLNPEDVVEE